MDVGSSRGAFLDGGASLVGIGSVCVLLPRSAVTVLDPAPLKNLAVRRSTFLPLVGQTFQITHDRGSLTVVLRQVSDLEPNVRRGAEGPILPYLLRSSPTRDSGPPLARATYSTSHARQGRIFRYVTPVGHRQTAQQYQAIIDSGPLTDFIRSKP